MPAATDLVPAWIAFAAAVVQAVAAVIQLRQHGRPRAGADAGLSPGVRIGLAALVLEFGGWLVTRGFQDMPPAVRLVAYAPAVLFGGIALVSCLRALLRSPDRPERPGPPNMPLSGNVEAWRLEVRRRHDNYERELAESRVSAPQALSLMLGTAGGFGIIYTSLTFSGGILLISQSVSWLNDQF